MNKIFDDERRNVRALKALLFFVVAFANTYFFHPVLYDNQTTRMSLACSIYKDGTTIIDPYADRTEDKAFFNGHYYCDKAPGLSLAASAVMPVLQAGARLFSTELCSPAGFKWLHYLLSAIFLGLTTAAASLLLFEILFYIGAGISGSFILSVAWVLGTISFTYSTHFYDHQFASILILAAVYLILTGAKENKDISPARVIIASFLLSYAVISEYTSAVTAVIVGVYLITKLKSKTRIFLIVLGGAVPAALLAYYNYISFGSVFSIGYFHEAHPYFNEQMSKGIGGVTYPSIKAMAALLFSPQRGLFWSSPFLLLAVFGFRHLIKKDRGLGIVCLTAVLARYLINSSYYDYMGGFTPGPRFIVPALPFLIIAGGALWSRSGRAIKLLMAGLCLGSVVVNTALNALEPHVPQVFTSPLMQYSIRLLELGYKPVNIGVLSGQTAIVSISVFVIILLLAFSLFCVRTKSKSKWTNAVIACVIASVYVVVYAAVGLNDRIEKKYLADFYIGVELNQNGNPEAAVSAFRKSIKGEPRFYRSYFYMGTALIKMNRYKEAAEAIEKSCELNQKNVQCYVSLAYAQYLAEDKDSARITCKHVLELDPGNIPAEKLLNYLGDY